MPEHPDGCYAPMGVCPVCSSTCFLDGTPVNFRIRPHWIQDRTERLRRQVEAATQGKRYYDLPNCKGSGRKPVDGSVSTPVVRVDRV